MQLLLDTEDWIRSGSMRMRIRGEVLEEEEEKEVPRV